MYSVVLIVLLFGMGLTLYTQFDDIGAMFEWVYVLFSFGGYMLLSTLNPYYEYIMTIPKKLK